MDIGLIVGFVTVFATIGAVLVRLGRVLERQDSHRDQLAKHDTQIEELKDGHGQHGASFEALRGEFKGLRGSIDTLVDTMQRLAERFERHIERT